MPTELIRLDDGAVVEVDLKEGEMRPASGAMKRVTATLNAICPLILYACKPIQAMGQQLPLLRVDEMEVELGLSFEGEGNVFLVKSKAGANLVVTLRMRFVGDSSPQDNKLVKASPQVG